MYYLNYSVVVNAFTNLLTRREDTSIDSGIIGILFLMKNSQVEGGISASKRLPVDEARVTNDINHIFSFEEEIPTQFNPNTFFILSENYEEQILSSLHNTKIDILSLACICLQSQPFENELEPLQLVSKFSDIFNLPLSLIEKCLEANDGSLNIEYNTSPTAIDIRRSLLEQAIPNPNSLPSISFKLNKGSYWQRSLGGDFGRGAYTQKMRPSSTLKELLFMPSGNFQKKLSYQGEHVASSIKPSSLNILYFGPSGTGKSTEARRELTEEKGVNPLNLTQVTFHPEYTYSDFVGSLKPITLFKAQSESSVFESIEATEPKYTNLEPVVEFSFEAGPFVRACINASNSQPNEPHALIIDEINRGNVPEIMGDIFQLLDREDSNYSNSNTELQKYLEEHCHSGVFDNGLVIPSNLYIYATINPADQNVYPLDTAFKRRWKRRYWSINCEHEYCSEWVLLICGNKTPWLKFIALMNNYITHKLFLSEDKQLGQFFIKYSHAPTLEEINEETLKVLSYLWEDIPKTKRKQIFGEGIFTFGEVYKLLLSTDGITKLFTRELSDEIIQLATTDEDTGVLVE